MLINDLVLTVVQLLMFYSIASYLYCRRCAPVHARLQHKRAAIAPALCAGLLQAVLCGGSWVSYICFINGFSKRHIH